MEEQPPVDIRQAWNDLVKSFATFAQIVLEAFKPVLVGMYDAFHAPYLAAGAPYGDTPEGMTRWYREAMAIAAEKERAYQERLRQWCVDDFRRQLQHPELPCLPVPQREGSDV